MCTTELLGLFVLSPPLTPKKEMQHQQDEDAARESGKDEGEKVERESGKREKVEKERKWKERESGKDERGGERGVSGCVIWCCRRSCKLTFTTHNSSHLNQSTTHHSHHSWYITLPTKHTFISGWYQWKKVTVVAS